MHFPIQLYSDDATLLHGFSVSTAGASNIEHDLCMDSKSVAIDRAHEVAWQYAGKLNIPRECVTFDYTF